MTIYNITLDIEQLPEGPYLGTSPDLPGLVVQADTPEDVIRLAPDIACDLIEVMRETDQPLPQQLALPKMPRRVALMVPARPINNWLVSCAPLVANCDARARVVTRSGSTQRRESR